MYVHRHMYVHAYVYDYAYICIYIYCYTHHFRVMQCYIDTLIDASFLGYHIQPCIGSFFLSQRAQINVGLSEIDHCKYTWLVVRNIFICPYIYIYINRE